MTAWVVGALLGHRGREAAVFVRIQPSFFLITVNHLKHRTRSTAEKACSSVRPARSVRNDTKYVLASLLDGRAARSVTTCLHNILFITNSSAGSSAYSEPDLTEATTKPDETHLPASRTDVSESVVAGVHSIIGQKSL